MKRVLGHCLAGVALVGGGIGIFAACAHDDQSFFVQDVLYPTPVAVGNSCTYSTDPNQSYISRGTLDVVFRSEYDPTYLVGNQLVQRANPQQQQIETSTINIQGAVVRVTDASGNQYTSFTSLTSGTVYPSTGSVPGYTPISITAIDPGTVKAVRDSGKLANGGTWTVVSYAKFFGHTLGGTYIESNEFEFPVTLCEGCLILYSSSDVDTTFPTNVKVPNCLGNQTTGGGTSSSLPVPCIKGQDTSIDCTQCQDFQACRGAYANLPNPILDAGGGG